MVRFALLGFPSASTVGHSSEAYDLSDSLLVGISFWRLHLCYQIHHGGGRQSNIVLWGDSGYFLTTVLFTVQLIVHNLNPSLYPVLTPSNSSCAEFKSQQQVVLKSLKISDVFDFLPQAKDFSWLPSSVPPQCKLILSTVSSSLSYKSLCARPDVRTVELLSTGDDEVKLNIFRQYLFIPGRDPLRQTRHPSRKRTNLNPLKLTILANELRECRIYRDEYQCLKEYLEVVSIQELWELILKRWIEDYSWTLMPKRANSDTVASGEGRG